MSRRFFYYWKRKLDRELLRKATHAAGGHESNPLRFPIPPFSALLAAAFKNSANVKAFPLLFCL